MPRFNFFKTALTDYKVGAVAKSSKYVVRRVLRRIEGLLDLVVEYGPGEGVMTRALLSKLSPAGKLIAVETNIKFVKMIEAMPDPRVTVIHGTAEQAGSTLKSLPKVNLIISSIPFSFLSPTQREKIVSDADDFLAPGGSLIIFHQYSLLMLKTVRKYFKNTSVLFELRNFPPCFIIVARKS